MGFDRGVVDGGTSCRYCPHTMVKAYSYLRFSTPEQMLGDSFRRQTAGAVEYCSKNGLTLDTEVTYNDLGISAFRGKNAETGRLAEFLEAVKSGLVPVGSFLLVESLDRVSRQAARKALRVLEALCDEGITVVTLNDGKQYTREALDSDPMSLLMSLLVFIRANEESVMKSKRLKSAWVGKRLKAVADGTILTQKVPGWINVAGRAGDHRFVLHRERAEIVRRIFNEASRGIGAHSIAEGLNRDKVPVFGIGKQWHRSYILKLLDNSPAVIGTYVPHVMEHVGNRKTRKALDPIPNYFPACVDLMVYQRVRAMRTKTASPLRGLATSIHNVFGGIVICTRCGGSMTLQNKGERSIRSLVCVKARYGAGCKYTGVRYPDVEEAFLQDANRILSITPSTGEDLEARHSQYVDAISALKERKGRLWAKVEAGVKVPDENLREVDLELEQLETKRVELLGLMEATSGPLVARRVADLKKCLGAEKLDRALVNATIRALFSGLSLNPDTGVATLRWKHGGESTFVFGFPSEEVPK